MKINKHVLFFLSIFFFGSITLKAQENIINFLAGSVSDATKLSKAYIDPFANGFGNALNHGWYNSAKPHKLGGFDITLSVATAIPPSSSKTFDVSKLGLTAWTLQNPANKLSPTVTGDKTNGPVLIPSGVIPGQPASITLPQGANLKFIPLPMIQVGIGLPLHTELIVRYLPKIDVPDVGNFSMVGFGLKNEFKEFIPGFKALPFNVSALFGYTKFTSNIDLNAPQSGNSKQTLDFSATGYTGKLLISKSIPVLTVYAGVGINKSKTDVDLKGKYNIPGVGVDISNPFSLEFKNSGVNANIGLRIKLAVIAFHFDYTVGKYKLYNAGVGINFR